MKLFMSLITLLTLTINLSFGQTNQAEVKTENERIEDVIHQFFNFLSTGDTTSMRKICYSEVQLSTTFTDQNGVSRILIEDFNLFLDQIGSPREDKWEERINTLEVKHDDNVAHVWMNYSFYLNGKLSHCGINSFQLFKENKKWKVISIIDTRRKENCN